MIQIYIPTNTNFEKNGDCTLLPASCEISAELNGSWQLTMSHPIDEEGRWKYITENSVIKAPSFNDEQLFRVKKVGKKDSGITVEAEPIFLDALNDCILGDVRPTNATGQQALDIMTAGTKYSGSSNISKKATAYYQLKNLIEAINGDDENSFINRWGGEILFDNLMVVINDRVGSDNGVEVRYGKNMLKDGIDEQIDMTNVVTRIYPKAYNGRTLNEDTPYVDSPLINSYPIVFAKIIEYQDVKLAEDVQGDGNEGDIICNTLEELYAALKEKAAAEYESGIDKPTVTLNITMSLISDTEEYKEYKDLEKVSLGDTVKVLHNRLGIESEARIIALTFNCLKNQTSAVTIGEAEYNYFNNVSSTINRIDSAIRPDGSVVAEQIKGFIDGARSQLRLQNTVAKKQDVRAILFEDLDPDSETFGALSIGTQGLQISRKRTEANDDWIWTTALTAQGLIANIIVAGIIADKTGKSYWDLDNGKIVLSGIFQQYDTDGNLSVRIADNAVRLYAWHKDGDEAGRLGALRSGDGKERTMIGLWADLENTVSLGYRAKDGTNGVHMAIEIDSTAEKSTFYDPIYINKSVNAIYLNNPRTDETVAGLTADIPIEGKRYVFSNGILVETY